MTPWQGRCLPKQQPYQWNNTCKKLLIHNILYMYTYHQLHCCLLLGDSIDWQHLQGIARVQNVHHHTPVKFLYIPHLDFHKDLNVIESKYNTVWHYQALSDNNMSTHADTYSLRETVYLNYIFHFNHRFGELAFDQRPSFTSHYLH